MPIQYIPYYPEPIQGQAILNNFTRTQRALKYRDGEKVFTRILRGMPLYEMETVETIGKNPKGNLVIRGECVSACAYLKQQGIKVDLVYIDPPFASGANYAKNIYLRRNPKVAKAIEQAEQEMNDDLHGFEEKMYGDIWNKEAYLNWMYENLIAIKSILNVGSAIYVHLDSKIGHYVRILMDEVFGEDNFRNEIVWCYKTSLRASEKKFGKDHDLIFLYANDDEHRIHPDKSDFPSSESTNKRWGAYADENGFVSNKHFAGSNSTIINTEDESKGFNIFNGIPRDWWEISANVSKGNTDEVIAGKYSTQKPEALLSRIIKASSNEGMIVADFFGGSGVTAKVAHDLGRTFIHVDVGINSIQTARDRLKSAKASFEILEVKDGVSLFRNPTQTMDKLQTLISGLGKVKDLSSFWAGGIHDSKLGLIPVFLPNLLDHTQKVLDKPLLNRILNEALPDLPDNVKQVAVYFIDLEDKKELEKFIQEYNPTGIKVDLRDLKEVLHEIVTNDEVEYKSSKGKDGYTIEFSRFYSGRLTQKIEAHNQKGELNNGRSKAKQIEFDEFDDDDNEEKRVPFKRIEISENGLELIELISLDCTSAKGKWNSDTEIKIDKKGFVVLNGEKSKEFWNGKITCKEKPLRLKVRNIAGDETVILLK
jgi:adenine-specific DNA-methyltransferase